MPTGVLLVNLGTPDAPTVPAVRRYLREFLSDPRVIDIPGPVRFFLVNGIIAPFRAPKSTEAYQTIWTDRGSPLKFHGTDLVVAVQERLGQGFRVALGMRYQNPSLASAVAQLMAEGCDALVVVPLFPQYSSAATGSALQKVMEVVGALDSVPTVHTVADYFDAPGFIGAQAAVARAPLQAFDADRVLFSFHGVPERHVKRSWAAGFTGCDLRAPCPPVGPDNRFCYRAQCFATARALAAALALPDDGWEVAFQSRLGRDPWIQPYTDTRIEALARAGTRRLAVLCPAFTADCLETTEEIGVRGRELFQHAGGDDLCLLPCVNASAPWADAVADMVRAAPRT